MKDILIIAPFSGELDSQTNNRFNYLAKLMTSRGYQVELVTTLFSHQKKDFRSRKTLINVPYKVTYLKEIGYKRNVSLKRMVSHAHFSYNLKQYLSKRKKPDLIYSAVPTLSSARIAAEFADQNNIKFLIDIQDLWPEAFDMIFKAGIIYRPFYKLSKSIYSKADYIFSVSETYLEVVRNNYGVKTEGDAIYIGTEMSDFDYFKRFEHKYDIDNSKINIVYLGTLGHSYNLNTVFEALQSLKKKTTRKFKLWIIGDGPLKKQFESYADKLMIDAEFTGRVPYPTAVSLLSDCDLALNPITDGSAASIINKHADYSMAGLPIINTQQNKEYRDIIEKYNIGFNSENSKPEEIALYLKKIIENDDLRNEQAANSRQFAENYFNRGKTYTKIISKIDEFLM